MKGKLIASLGVFDLLIDNQIYAQLPGSPLISLYQKLSLKNCKAIRDGYDLDELAELELKKETAGFFFYQSIGFIKGFNEGFQKALEILGDKKFSEGDMMLSWDAGVMSQAICTSNYFGLKRQEQLKEHRDYYKENLKPVSLKQTEWDVEVVYQRACCSDNFTCGDEDNCMICTQTYPKLDSDGCLILKRI